MRSESYDGTVSDASYVRGIRGKRAAAIRFNDTGRASFDGDAFDAAARSDAFSLTYWIKPVEETGGVAVAGIDSEYAPPPYNDPAVYSEPHRSDTDGLTLTVNNGTIKQHFRTGYDLAEDEWHHVIHTYDGETATTYVDADEVASEDDVVTVEPMRHAVVGGLHPDMSGDELNATVDQVRVYSRVLDDIEIQSFMNSSCNNRQRTMECVNSPGLCDTPYASEANRYHCNYGEYDDPKEQDVGVCCPRDQHAEKILGEWTCIESDACGIASDDECSYNISANEDKFLNATYDGTNDRCVSRVPNLHSPEQPAPTKSEACCYVPKDGQLDYWFKDGNVKVYG